MMNLPSKDLKNSVNNPDSNFFKKINARFIHFYPHKCSECGLCHQSYYCDTFLNRNSLTGGPIIDPRNCTGCGLCVQICNRGALQLVKPSEMVVMISDLQESREIIKKEELFPFVFFSTNDIRNHSSLEEKRWNTQLKSPKEMLEPVEFDRENLLNWSKKLWELRIDKDEVAIKGEKDLRADLKDKCLGTIDNIFRKSKIPKGNPDKSILHNTIQKAIVWSQLIWSDPCQILWESPLVVVVSALQIKNSKIIFEWQNPIKNSEIPNLLKICCGKEVIIKSSFIILHKGKLVEGPILEKSSSFKLRNLSDENIKIYGQSGLGINRLGGIDVLTCGAFFIDTKDWIELKKNQYDIFQIAGVPINRLLENKVLKNIFDLNFQRSKVKV